MNKKITEVSNGPILKCISGDSEMYLDPIDGVVNIKSVAPGTNDPDFDRYSTMGCPYTNGTFVCVSEVIVDVKLRTLLSKTGRDLDSLSFTEAQIVQFLNKYDSWIKDDGYDILFVLKVSEVVGVVGVYKSGDLKTTAVLYTINYDRVFRAAHGVRLVCPCKMY